MIVTIAVPSNITTVTYGKARMQPDESQQLQVPDYVAFTLLKLAGVTLVSGSADGSAAALLADADEDWEANYLFQAYGKPLPAAPRLPAAITLMDANGEPAVSMS